MINQFPVEVLAHIFSFCQASRNVATDPPDLSIMNIGSVCQHWRKVALQFPTLWTNIDTAHMRSARVSLGRSGTVPLKVSIRQSLTAENGPVQPVTSSFCQTLSGHSHRIHELHIQTDSVDPDGLNFALQCLNRPALELHSLLLSAQAPGPSVAPGQVTRRGRLPMIFRGQYPKLKRLYVEGTTYWSKKSFRDLTHLWICNSFYDNPFVLQLYDLFSTSPKLHELCITFKGHSNRQHYRSFTQTIKLPNLRIIYLRADIIPELVPLLSRLVLSPGVEIYVEGGISSDFRELEHIFSKDLGGLSGITKIRVETQGSSLKLRGVSGATAFNVHLNRFPGKPFPLQCLDILFADARAEFIKELHLKHFDTANFSDIDWSKMFQQLSSLEELTLIGERYVPDEIIAGLLPYRSSNGEIEVPCLDFSVLQVLCPPATGGPIPSLAKVIQQRRKNYCSIQTLRLSQAYLGISPEEIALIQSNIGTMEIVANPKYISDSEFEEVLNMQYFTSAPKSWW
jgi:F-box-like